MAAPSSSSSAPRCNPRGRTPSGGRLIAGIAAAIFAVLAGTAACVFAQRRPVAAGRAHHARAPAFPPLDEARMMAIIRASSDAIITIDNDQKIILFNPAAEALFRCPAQDAMGSPIDRFIPERFRQAHKQHVERFGVTGISERQMGRQLVLSGLRADGEEFPIEASISQITDGGDKLYTVVLRDVSERIHAENALKASREELRKLSANLQDVREEDRTRIARELHDDLGQQLAVLKIDLSSVQQALESGTEVPSSVLTQLRNMRRLIDATVASMRRIAADMRPVMLDDLGLLPAIEWLTNDFTARHGIEVERRIEPGNLSFSRGAATTLFRVLQDALTNVAQHAQATRVTLTLTVDDDRCTLRIADNGRGAALPFEGKGHTGKSFGLLSIRERAHMLGGSVSIDTAIRQGFTITVILPIASVQEEGEGEGALP